MSQRMEAEAAAVTCNNMKALFVKRTLNKTDSQFTVAVTCSFAQSQRDTKIAQTVKTKIYWLDSKYTQRDQSLRTKVGGLESSLSVFTTGSQIFLSLF